MAKKKVSAVAPSEETVLVVRTCDANLQGYGGFQWPSEGPVEAPDWSPDPICGGGLHGLLYGWGDWSMLSWDTAAKALIVEVARAALVELSGKVKFPSGIVRRVTDLASALCELACNADRITEMVRSISEAARLHEAASGDDAKLAASGYAAQLAASGNDAKLAASGNAAKLAASGNAGVVVSAGYRATAQAGPGGVIALAWWDEEAKRPRVAVGYVGEDGIKAGVWYRAEAGRLVEVPRG